jgi:hypothetical protein
MLLTLSWPGVTSSAVVVRAEPYRILQRMQPALTKTQAVRLARIFQEEGQKHGLSWRLLASIAFNESSLGLFRVNPRTADYGLMQINIRNIEAYGYTAEQVATNDRLSVRLACIILADHRARFKDRFEEWVGTYRSGLAIGRDRIRKNAVAYDAIIKETKQRIVAYESALLAF